MRRRVWAVLPALALLAAACQAPSTGTQSPDSPKGVRHGTDAGQPGGSPGFTIEVTEDMCAEIAACSGRLSKQRPVYIWDATSDDWARAARTAADIGTDFIPGVTHVKTAYDAYQRIQNGEDPIDVLMAAGGDAALGLIPGLKPAKKLGKALDKAEDVADAGSLRNAVKNQSEVIAVTPDGVALPKDPKYRIPARYAENPYRSGSYGEVNGGKFKERLRIDPATPPGRKGPSTSHYHLDGKSTHYSPADGNDPGFQR